ncbi:MAG TPA: FISUMP domain-containing protein [Cyclobacteriaceae bacterium]|nr:FISUMP domain-containing protein [Cyclobacteriaceae bacterium]
MKGVFTVAAVLLVTASLWAQAPNKMSYQAVVRNSSDVLITNTTVGMKISILQGAASGTAVYVETQTPTTNANGLVSIEIGGTNATIVSGDFTTIDWGADTYFIKTETDPTGGANYTITGTSQLMSVPYALQAAKVANLSGTNTGDQTLSGLGGVASNTPIVGDTKTKITYDTKGLVTSGADATTADIASSTDKNYVTDAQKAVLVNTSGTNTGDETNATIKAKLGITTLTGSNTGDQDGSETKVTAGTNVSVTGAGTVANPYVVAATQAPGTVAGQMQYWNGTAWITVAPGTTGQFLVFDNGVPTWATTVGVMTLGPTDVYNPTTGKIWMDRNLGASQVATSSTDAAAYGDLYQWGRGSDGHQLRTSATTTTLSSTDVPGHGDFILNTAPQGANWRSPENTNLWQGVNGINNPCPTGYRVPTKSELDAERLSWSSDNTAGAFASPLKLTEAGYRADYIGVLQYVGAHGYYWSSTIAGGGESSILIFHDNGTLFNAGRARAVGASVRCIKD